MAPGRRSMSPTRQSRGGQLSPLRQRPKSVLLEHGQLGTDFNSSGLIDGDVSIGDLQFDLLQPVSVRGVAPPSIDMLFPPPPLGSSLSGLSALQNQHAEPMLKAIFTGDDGHGDSSQSEGSRPASVLQKKRWTKDPNELRSTQSYDDLMNSLTSKKLAPAVAAPVVVEKAAASKPRAR